MIFFNLIMGVISALQIYTQPAVMTDGRADQFDLRLWNALVSHSILVL